MPSAVPPSFGDAALRDRRVVAGPLPRPPIGAALYRWRSAPEPTGSAPRCRVARRSVRRLPGPFAAAVAPVSTSHRISLPTLDGYSSRSQPALRDVAGRIGAPGSKRQGRASGGSGGSSRSGGAARSRRRPGPAGAGSAGTRDRSGTARRGRTWSRGRWRRSRAWRHASQRPAAGCSGCIAATVASGPGRSAGGATRGAMAADAERRRASGG